MFPLRIFCRWYFLDLIFEQKTKVPLTGPTLRSESRVFHTMPSREEEEAFSASRGI